MTDLPQNDTMAGGALADWGAEALDQLAGVAQAALDVTAWVLVAGLLWVATPQSEKTPVAPGPIATSACVVDCIETVALTSGS